MPRYVILLHQTPPDSLRPTHWDLMLENGNVLRTWALADTPQAGDAIRADALPDHRLAYLTYEGPVSGDRGQVTRWDHGEFQWTRQAEDELRIQLQGQRLQGEARLTRTDPVANVWRFLVSRRTEASP
ncbi:MAG: hypothetical protein JJ992_11935 [Planctomycetes bacterium]|nr:hypothetical protein [Planctomycetota bacterium]